MSHTVLVPQASTFTVDEARGMHVFDLDRHPSPVARSQASLRREGARVARGILAHYGLVYRGTSGWWVTAYVDADGRVGYVNTARGVAALSDQVLSPEVIEACTVPGQGTGPKVSGAAAWTAPDAGEALHASAPEGWTQLVLDLRTGVSREHPTEPVVATLRIVAWGLVTCYGRRGTPGVTVLDAHPEPAELPARDWPATAEARSAMEGIALDWLDGYARRLADEAGCGPEVAAALDRPRGSIVYASRGPGSPRLPSADISGAITASGAYAFSGGGSYTPDGCVRAVLAQCYEQAAPLRDGLRASGVMRLAELAGEFDLRAVRGCRYIDLIEYLLRRIVHARMLPAAEALFASLDQYSPPSADHTHAWDLSHRTVNPMLARIAPQVTAAVLRGLGQEPHKIEEQCIATYYAAGHVAVDLAVPRFDAAVDLGGAS